MININKIKLASNGQVDGVPEELTIRALTGKELSIIYSSLTTASIDKVLGSIIDEKVDVSILPDEDKFQILLEARKLTFGPEIKQQLLCPHCGQVHEHIINIDELEFKYLPKSFSITAAQISNGDTIELRIPTAAVWQQIDKVKERLNYTFDYDYLFLMASRIAKVNNKGLSITELIKYLENLQGKYFTEVNDLVNFSFGYNKIFTVECTKHKGYTFQGGLGINADLFR